MRLTENEIAAIKSQVYEKDPKAKIYLFGSRVDDAKKGGDIDLLVLSKVLSFSDKIKIRVALYGDIGEQKIDIVIAKDKNESAFVEHAFDTGVAL